MRVRTEARHPDWAQHTAHQGEMATGAGMLAKLRSKLYREIPATETRETAPELRMHIWGYCSNNNPAVTVQRFHLRVQNPIPILSSFFLNGLARGFK